MGRSMIQHNRYAVMILYMKKRTKFAVGPSYIGSPLIKIHVVAGNYITALKVVVEGNHCITNHHTSAVNSMVHSPSQPKRTTSAVMIRLLM